METYLGGGNSGSGKRVEEVAAEDGTDALNGPTAQSEEAGTETTDVYEFPDTKTDGTVTVIKKWDDQSTNAERPMADISISTQKPSKNPLGYTMTFHADAEKGLTFEDGNTENDVVYNGNGQAVSGTYKGVTGGSGVVGWYTDRTYQTKIGLDENGELVAPLDNDIDVWPKEVTFEVKGYYPYKNKFNQAIPDTVTSVVFTDEVMPVDTDLIDVDADGDGGVVAWTEENGAVMKVSSQNKGVKVQAAKNSKSMFQYKYKIQSIDTMDLDTSNVTNMTRMFSGCSKLASLDVSAFDTTNVTSMDGMFNGCSRLTSLDVSSFNTVNVKNMSSIFYGCSGLASLDVSAFDTTNVTRMDNLFRDCSGLTSLDVTTFNTNNVTDMCGMFAGCSALVDIKINFNIQNVNQIGEEVRWNQNGGSSHSGKGMFDGCCSLTSLDLSSWKNSKITVFGYMFAGCTQLRFIDLSNFDFSSITDINYLFDRCKNLETVKIKNLSSAKVETACGTFSSCKQIPLGLESLNLKYAKDLSNMFSHYEGNKITIDLDGLCPEDVSDMFWYSENLTDVVLEDWNMGKDARMHGMFWGASNLTNIEFLRCDTSSVTDMSDMFLGCSNLASLNLSLLNTSSVTDMSGMFQECNKLATLDLSSMDTRNVTNMKRMFDGCSGLTSLDLTPLDTSSVTDMSSMFYGCSGIIRLDLTPLNTVNVTSMDCIFSGCSSLTELETSMLNTSRVKSMYRMFDGCISLTSLDVSSFDTAKVTSMTAMFSGCNTLTTLTTGTNFKFVGTNYNLPGTWRNTAGETFTSGNFPSNIADTYTRIS